MKGSLEIGDIVRVHDFGFYYSHYDVLFQQLGFKNTMINEIPYLSRNSSSEWVVFGLCKHLNRRELKLCAIRSTSEDETELLIDEKGVTFIRKYKITTPFKILIL